MKIYKKEVYNMSTTIEEDLETRLRKYMKFMIISIEETMRDELKRDLREPENAQKEQKVPRELKQASMPKEVPREPREASRELEYAPKEDKAPKEVPREPVKTPREFKGTPRESKNAPREQKISIKKEIMKAPRELEMASMPEQGSRNQEKTPRELKSAPREHNEDRCDEKKEVTENKYDDEQTVVAVKEDYLHEEDTNSKQQKEENKQSTEVFKKVTFNLCTDIDERIIELSNYMKQLEYCYSQCGMFEMDIMIQWHRSNVKYEKVLKLLKQSRAEISKEAEDENNESYYKYRFILTIEHSEETDSVSGLSNVPANISPASPHYLGFYDGDSIFLGASAQYGVHESIVEEAMRNEVGDNEEDKRGSTGVVLETPLAVIDVSSAYYDTIVDEKDALGKQLNNINTEVKYATENANNNADETNTIDIRTDANIDDASSTKACANVSIKANNENAEDDNDAKGNNGDDKIACNKTGAIDKEGSDELAEDVTIDTGDETLSYANKDNNPADEKEYIDGDLELKKASREKRAKLWLWVPGYYCYKSRKCVKDCPGVENLHRFPKDPTRHLRVLTADPGEIWSNSSISFRHLRVLTADPGEIWSNSSISFRHLRVLTADPGEIWSNLSISFRILLTIFPQGTTSLEFIFVIFL
ncbi:hypothetical protein CVS40_10286 [Lucilia cuprina]|nr:hypothetical protein CVS40_10286 [Lucilia cuprina]